MLVVIAIIAVLIALLLPAVQAAREAARAVAVRQQPEAVRAGHPQLHLHQRRSPPRAGGTRRHPRPPPEPVDEGPAAPVHGADGRLQRLNFNVGRLGRPDRSGPGGQRDGHRDAGQPFLCPSDTNPGNTGNFSSQSRPVAVTNYPNNAGTNRNYNGGVNNGPCWFTGGHSQVGIKCTLATVTDGTSNTAMMSEWVKGTAGQNKPGLNLSWNMGGQNKNALGRQPEPGRRPAVPGVDLDPVGLQGRVLGEQDGGRGGAYWHITTPNTKSCDAGSPWDGIVGPSSSHSGGVNVLLLDGSVKFIKNSISYTTWTGLGTMNGGEVIGSDQL